MKKLLTFLTLSFLVASSSNEELIIDLEQNLMAPCCWSGTVYDHGHSQLENEIRSMVDTGQTRQQVLDHYVHIYGERILAIPVAQGFNVMAWVVPVMIAIAALIIFGLYLRTPKNEENKPTYVSSEDTSIPFNDQIEKELQEMD